MGVGCEQWFMMVTMSFSVSHGCRVCAVVHNGDHVLQCECFVLPDDVNLLVSAVQCHGQHGGRDAPGTVPGKFA